VLPDHVRPHDDLAVLRPEDGAPARHGDQAALLGRLADGPRDGVAAGAVVLGEPRHRRQGLAGLPLALIDAPQQVLRDLAIPR
jgi:hypothetical protein